MTLILLALFYGIWIWFNPYGFDPLYDRSVATPIDDAEFSPPSNRSYVAFGLALPAGYPLFLNLFSLVFASMGTILKVQLILHCAAVAFLGWSLLRVFQAPLLAFCTVLALFAISAILNYYSYLLPESLYLSLLYLMLGSLVLLLKRPTARLMLVAALLCGLSLTVKPAGMLVLAIWPLLLWFLWKQYPGPCWKLAAAALAPLALCFLAEYVAWRAYHPDEAQRTRNVNFHLFAKALMVPSEPVLQDPLKQSFLAESRRIRRHCGS